MTARMLKPQTTSSLGGIPTPLKHMKVNWDDDIPNIWENKSHVPNHQSELVGLRERLQETPIINIWEN